ncbi:hypothetical protein ACOME3_002959 [Neoechinorhynchus agilis]
MEEDYSERDNTAVEYWKAAYESLHADYMDYHKTSTELEAESKSQLEEYERALKKVENRVHAVEKQLKAKQEENDILKDQNRRKCEQMSMTIQSKESVICELKERIKSLERTNEDMERAGRIMKASMEKCEAELNRVLEKTVLQETELEIERSKFKEQVQLLKDEISSVRNNKRIESRNGENNGQAQSNNNLTPLLQKFSHGYKYIPSDGDSGVRSNGNSDRIAKVQRSQNLAGSMVRKVLNNIEAISKIVSNGSTT